MGKRMKGPGYDGGGRDVRCGMLCASSSGQHVIDSVVPREYLKTFRAIPLGRWHHGPCLLKWCLVQGQVELNIGHAYITAVLSFGINQLEQAIVAGD